MYNSDNIIEMMKKTAPSIRYGIKLTIMIKRGRASSHVKKTKSMAAITKIIIGITVMNLRTLPLHIRYSKRLPLIK